MSERKFCSLPLSQQHKKCLEALRAFMEGNQSIDVYLQFIKWMGFPQPNTDYKSLSNAFHHHLEMAGMHLKEHNLLPSISKGDRKQAEPLLTVDIYLDHIRSAHNVGSIIRTVEAFSLGELYFSSKTPKATHKQVKDASMGASEWVIVHHDAAVTDLKRPIIALETAENAVSIYEYQFPSSFTLAVGNEEYGLSDELLKAADVFVKIPMRGKKNSLNVANAFAIAAACIDSQLRGL